MKRRYLILACIAYAFLRWALLIHPGYVFDVMAYKRWGIQAARNGISQVYRASDMDYPPLYAYLLTPMAKIYSWLAPDAYANLQDSTLLTVLFKFPPLLFDLAIAALLHALARKLRPGPGPWPWTWILPAAYLLNPAILFNNGYWGEPDAVHSFFILACFSALGFGTGRHSGAGRAGGPVAKSTPWRGAWPAWVLLTLATLMKPLGAPYFPLLLVLSLALYGLRSTLIGMAASVVTAVLVFSPFIATGQGAEVYRRVMGDATLMPFTSSNAHNIWWVVGGWKNADVPWFGPITATQLSLFLFGACYAALLWKAHRLHRAQPEGLDGPQVLLLAAAVGFSFFMLSTHLHENHMFIVIPLLAPLLPFPGPWRKLFVAASLAVLLNLVLHDLILPARWPFTIGGPTGFQNHHLKRPFFATELTLIWLSTFFNVGLYAAFLFGIFRRGDKSLPASLRRDALTIPGSAASVSRSARRSPRGSC